MSQPTWIGNNLGGRYKIEELVGQGGMSAVYKATDPNLRRVVAVKMIHPHLSQEPGFVRRFEEEAAAVAQLRHPNIVQVFDFNHDSDTYYMVLEFIPGETLQTRLKRYNTEGRQLELSEVLTLAIDLCDAVEYAHRHGMIHRDIKPANVLINIHNQAILMDFGIAKIAGSPQHTATGAVIGTAMYMSPEQIRSETIDGRSDIYSLGVTLFEMVSGHPPFEADSAMTLMIKHLNDPVPDLRQLRSGLPPELVAIINKALAKHPAERFQSAAEMANALRNVQARLGLASRNPAVSPANAVNLEPTEVAASPSAAPSSSSAPRTFQSSLVSNNSGASVQKNSLVYWVIGGGSALFLLIICLAAGVLAYSTFNRRTSNQSVATDISLAAGQVTIPPGLNAAVPTATVQPSPTPPPPTSTKNPTETPVSTATSSPTPTPTSSPTPAPTASGPLVRILSIYDEGGRYAVIYETVGFVEKIPGMHIHFYFNTVKPENAGLPGSGPWIMYGGPNPFTGYRVSDRPSGATQMCAAVANTNHTIIPDSGNCVDLP